MFPVKLLPRIRVRKQLTTLHHRMRKRVRLPMANL